MSQLYACKTEGAIALAAATPKTIIGVNCGSQNGICWKKYRLSFDGTTASAAPVLVELGTCSFATNVPGTNSTSTTIRQVRGRVITSPSSSAAGWTAEPTVITVFEEYLLTPAGGLVIYDFPLSDEPDSAPSTGFVIRLTAPAIVNARASIYFTPGS